MIWLVVLALMLAAFAVVSWPLLSSAKASEAEEVTTSGEWEDMVDQRNAAYQAIKELDFEHELGNLSQQDYQSLREQYRTRAAGLLRSLDRMIRSRGVKAAATSREGPAERVLQGGAMPAAEGGAPTQLARPAGQTLPCSACGKLVPLGDRFCSSCGAAQARLCPSCGAARPASDTFCGECGAHLESEA
ncbi:MAG: zinc ribbon domain-containing protein [Chloroflexota bacterium]|nr:zinc ribbon domain-containing protein [Chloroflexota bacterium]